MNLHPFDLAVLLAYFAGVVALGFWLGRGRQDLSEYLLGGRRLPWWAILGSIVATETSTVTFLSIPGQGYEGNLRFLQLTIGYLVGRIVVAVVLLPLYFRGQLFTAYEVLHRRFGGATKRTASLMFLVGRNAGDGLRLYLAALVLDKVVGLSLTSCIVLIGIITIVYTVTGGMKSVVWNDCLQLVIYVGGAAIAGGWLLSNLPEGLHTYLEYAQANQKLQVFDFRWDLREAYTFWAGLVGGFFVTLATHGTDQMMVQRYLGARTQRDAALALVTSGLLVMLQFSLFLLIGVGLSAYYHLVRTDVSFEKADQVFATFIVQEMPQGVGIIGLLLAAVFAAAMSTLSSSLNSSATAALRDFGSHKMSEARSVRWSRALTVLFGITQIGLGLLGTRLDRTVIDGVMLIASFTGGLLVGIFALGILVRRADQTAAFIGLAAGIAATTSTAWLTNVAWPWYALVGSAVTFSLGSLVSWISPADETESGKSLEEHRD